MQKKKKQEEKKRPAIDTKSWGVARKVFLWVAQMSVWLCWENNLELLIS